MAERPGAEVMIRQVERLAADLRDLTGIFGARAAALLAPPRGERAEKVYLTGDGDSYHASCAAAMAFETIADIACAPVSALRFSEYGAQWMRPSAPDRTLVIAVSASGGTERVLRAVERARHHGAQTLAVTGTPGSAVTREACHSLVIGLPDTEPSPGIRSYQASLLGLLLIAIQLAQTRGRCSALAAERLRHELSALAEAVDATARAVKASCRDLATVIAAAPVMAMVGSGPSYGSALFSAAKVVEGAGIPAIGQDLEEWCHVERHAGPADMPVVVIAPPGRSHPIAADVAALARKLGRRVITVAQIGDTDLTRHADTVLPVHGGTREEFTPLLYHVFASYLACFTAQRLGRAPFQMGRLS